MPFLRDARRAWNLVWHHGAAGRRTVDKAALDEVETAERPARAGAQAGSPPRRADVSATAELRATVEKAQEPPAAPASPTDGDIEDGVRRRTL